MENVEDSFCVHGEVVRLNPKRIPARNGAYHFSAVELKVDLSNDRTFIIFPEYSGLDFFEFPKLCWPGARLSAYGLRLNNRLEDGCVILCVGPKSELVLEPFRPVSVVEAVESFRCLRAIDLKYRLRSEEPFYLAKGKAIHSLFDHLVRNPSNSTKSFFDLPLSSAISAFLEILPGSSTSITYEDLKNEFKRHHKNLAYWISNNFGDDFEVDTEFDKISIRYGLKGRADAVFYSDSSKTIVELKSGKFPSDDHLLQLHAYGMIMLGTSAECEMNCCLVYSSTGLSKKVENLSFDNNRSVLHGRNRCVALRRYYAFKDNFCIPSEINSCDVNTKCYSRKNCEDFYYSRPPSSNLSNDIQREYYDTWFTLIAIDEWHQESEFARILDKSTLNERLADGSTIPVKFSNSCNVVESELGEDHGAKKARAREERNDSRSSISNLASSGNGQVDFICIDGIGDLSEGDEIIVHRGDVCATDSIRGRVNEVGQTRLSLVSKIDIRRHSRELICNHNGNEMWYVDRVPFLRGREVSRKGLLTFLRNAAPNILNAVIRDFRELIDTSRHDANPTKLASGISKNQDFERSDLLHPPTLNRIKDKSSDDETGFDRLNQNQKEAVIRSLGAPVYHLIHGPPGTGKTKVLSTLIVKLINQKKRVLLACPTNVALDNVLIALLALGFKTFLRVGGRFSYSDEFVRVNREIGNPGALVDHLSSSTTDFQKFRRCINTAKLIGATAYQCASNPLFLKQHFDIAIVDEAGQLDEPSTLAPLSLADRFVLSGDHLQLPPVVNSRLADSNKTPMGLEISLFERLFVTSATQNATSLRVQYRMNSEVQEISSKLFYDSKLVASPEICGRRFKITRKRIVKSEIWEIIDPEKSTVFVDVCGSMETGKASAEEAEVAVEIVDGLMKAGLSSREIGIITPYRAQQSLIRQKLNKLNECHDLSVDTVDRFQGGEREVIIISLARSNAVTSFLADPKRLNVSLTRARSKLILLGKASVLEEHPLFHAIVKSMNKIRMVR